MINEENLIKMYEGIINEKELTTRQLNQYGFNSNDLSNLIENGVLIRIKRGYYSFSSPDKLYEYTKKLISQKEYEKAYICLRKCFEIDPKHPGANLQLFIYSIRNYDYDNALQYLENINNQSKNLYLYLLSMIIDLPDNFKNQINNLKYKDIIFKTKNTENYDYIERKNKIRLSIFNQRFGLALKQFKENKDKKSIENVIVGILLIKAIEKQVESRKIILELLKNNEYEKLIEYLEQLQKQHSLSMLDRSILCTTKDLLNIIKTGIIPKTTISTSNSINIFEAIERKDYKLALSLCNESIGEEKNNINILLKNINNEINKIMGVESKQKEDNNQCAAISQDIELHNSTTNTTEVIHSYTIKDIIRFLMVRDLNNTSKALKSYLDSIGKLQYEFLIMNLIKISLINNDISFTKPMVALTYISKGNFKFNVFNYIKSFYETLYQNRFEEARIYLDIISKSKQLGITNIMLEPLEQTLNSIEKNTNCEIDNKTILEQQQLTKNYTNTQVENTDEHYNFVHPNKELQQIEEKVETNNITTKSGINQDLKMYIEQKINEVITKGIVILKPMSNEKREQIHNIIKYYSYIISFSIGSDDKRRIVLKHTPYITENIDFTETLKLANKAYEVGDYDSCIQLYKQVFSFGKSKTFVYARLGLAYMKKFDIDIAIDYLTVATELSKNEDGKYIFTDLIAKLEGKDYKPHFIMNSSDFKYDIEDYYGIDNIQEIKQLVSSGMDLDSACQNVGIDQEQKNIVILILARECYSKENYVSGDKYLKLIEKTKNKSKFVNSLYEEIKKNKRFYKNRVNNLTLSLDNKKPM